jgi:hypothetical protein
VGRALTDADEPEPWRGCAEAVHVEALAVVHDVDDERVAVAT